MILFLIEIFLLGCAIAVHFRENIEDFFLAFIAILLGLFGFFITVLILTVAQIPLSVPVISIVIGVEIGLLLLSKWLISRKTSFKFRWSSLWFLASGLFFILGSVFFLKKGYVFVSPDSLYLVIMGRNILETGLAEWYFTSPLQWGMFVQVIQIIGMLFGYEYTWFIQPIISFTFLVVFGYLIFRAVRGLTKSKVLPYLLPILSVGVLVTSNLYWVSQFYIHTNLLTGISLFLAVISLYFTIREENDSWLGIAAIFLIVLGMTRSENVILASLVIVLAIATRQLTHRKMIWTFLPYLVFQIVWNLIVIRNNPIAFGNSITVSQLLWVTVALAALALLILLTGIRWVREKVLPRLNLMLVIGIGILLVGVFLLSPKRIFLDTWDTLQTMFVSGKWFATFWGVIMLLLLVKIKKSGNDRGLVNFFNILIFAFFSMIVILGYLKGNYHNFWYDSANRMYIHILPILVFYLAVKISSNSPIGKTSNRLE